MPRRPTLSLTLIGLATILALTVTPNLANAAVGTRWFTGDLDAAMLLAKKSGKRVLVKFEASWCGPCKRLATEVFHTDAGAALTKGLIAVRVDFDAPANRKHIERYVVLGLPTTVVVAPSGQQVLRIMGYEGKAAFERILATASDAVDPLPALEARFAANASKDDATRLALGKALLVRGAAGSEMHRRALTVLEPLLWHAAPAAGGDAEKQRRRNEHAAEVLFTLGRYHHRVRRDPATAQHLWRELALRFGTTSWAGGAWWWFARSQAELGRVDVGRDVLQRRSERHPADESALSQWVAFAAKHHLVNDKPALLAAAAALERVRIVQRRSSASDRAAATPAKPEAARPDSAAALAELAALKRRITAISSPTVRRR